MSRLEEIKSKWKERDINVLSHMDWLINRVEELEEELEKREIDQINKHYENKNLINRLKEQNKRYKQALEDIASQFIPEANAANSVLIARKALKGESE